MGMIGADMSGWLMPLCCSVAQSAGPGDRDDLAGDLAEAAWGKIAEGGWVVRPYLSLRARSLMGRAAKRKAVADRHRAEVERAWGSAPAPAWGGEREAESGLAVWSLLSYAVERDPYVGLLIAVTARVEDVAEAERLVSGPLADVRLARERTRDMVLAWSAA